MATSGENKKGKKHEEEAKDRLSNLPDDLLLHILSLLPETKWSFRTSVLSKRWKCLWASLPDLIFHGKGRDGLSFKKFVRHVLSSRNNNFPVTKFCFRYKGVDKSLITRIINYSVTHNVQHFSISLKFASITILFPLFNCCKSLKTLELENFGELLLLRDISLPTLTTLHISSCTFTSRGSSLTSIDPFVGLVNLKSLILKDFHINGVSKLKISGPQLHSLTIRQTYFIYLHGIKVEIFAPRLHSFNFIHMMPMEFSNLDFPLLETAGIDTRFPSSEYNSEKEYLDLINMLQGIYHAQSLNLSSNTIKALMKYPGVLEDQASPFVRLKTLNVKSYSKSFNIPDNVMNYFVSGSAFGKDIRIKIEEKQRLES